MNNVNGRQRVIITNVCPCIDAGTWPAKAIIHQSFKVTADIFTDGHDQIAASLLVRHESKKKWTEVPLRLVNNDHWERDLIPDMTGFYEFQVSAWIDHFRTWREGTEKKIAAGQDIKTDIQIGIMLLEETLTRLKPKQQEGLSVHITSVKKENDPSKFLELMKDEGLTELIAAGIDKTLITLHPQILKFEVERERAGYSTWYEMFPRSAASVEGMHGTFNDVKNLLPRIAEMGFDVLYFPPIHPIGQVNRKGRNNSLTASADDPGSPWAIGNANGGHKSIHPELGTLKDFKVLIAEAAKLDIEIALDIAFQCAPDHPYVKEHPEWFKWRPDGSVQYAENPPKKYEDILPFHFESTGWKNLWDELKSVIEFWIGHGVKIFRIDNPHTKPFAFWHWLIKEVRTEYPEVIFLAEAFTRPRLMERLGQGGFNQSYTYFTWRNTKKELEEYVNELTQTDKRYYFRPNFWPNTPDILTNELVEGGENNHIIRLILAATLSSSYGIYGPVFEFLYRIPMPGKEEYIDNEKYEIRNWGWDQYTRMKEIISRVNRIRKQNKALHNTYNIAFANTSNENVICYAKTDEESGNRMVIAVNLDPWNTQNANVQVPLQHLGIAHDQAYTVRDLLSGDKFRWHGEWNFVSLNPSEMPAHIFIVEPQTN